MNQLDVPLRTLRLPSIPTLTLYAVTLVAEVPVMFARLLLTFAVAALVLLVKGESLSGAQGLAELALIPTGWSILALLTPLGGGWWWGQNMGGREPSEREQAAYQDAVQLLQANAAEPLRLPRLWFVVDEHQPDAAVCGNTLMLSRGLLENEYLPAVLAHELGHLDTSDGKLTAALNRLIINPLPRTREKQPKERNVLVVGGERFLLYRHAVRRRAVGAAAARALRPRRSRAAVLRACVGRLLARTRVHRRPVRRPPRAGRGARGLPRGPRPPARPPRPVRLAHRAHPPTNRAAHRPAPQNRPQPHPRLRASHTAASASRAVAGTPGPDAMTTPTSSLGDTIAPPFAHTRWRRPPQPAAPVAPGTEPVKAAPTGPPVR